MSERMKLNIFQRGAFQKVTTYFLYFLSVALTAFILDWADKRIFTATIKEAELQGISLLMPHPICNGS